MPHRILAICSLIAVGALFRPATGSAEAPDAEPQTKNDDNAIAQFRDLLDRSPEQLDGCRGDWRGKTDNRTMAQIMCRQYDGPAPFRGVGTTIVLLGQRVSMVATQVKSSDAEQAKARFELLRKQVDEACEVTEESDSQARYQCGGERVSLSYSRAGGQWKTSLTVSRD